MRARSPPLCPHCSKPLLPMRYGVAFGPIAVRIIDSIARAGSAGIRIDDLFDIVYGNNSGATHDRVRNYVGQINMALAGSGVAIRSDRHVYRITRIPIQASA